MNVYRMELLGATVVPVESGTGLSKTPQRACGTGDERTTTHYIIGSVVGPIPSLHGRDFRRDRSRSPVSDAGALGQPSSHRSGVRRWWSNAMDIQRILDDAGPAGRSRGSGKGIATGHHSATLTAGTPGVSTAA